jgi:hypothetical protein
MKSSIRLVLFFVGIGVLLLSLYYLIPYSWSFYPITRWRGHYFGPRTFPWTSFLGLALTFVIGFAWFKLLFPSLATSSSSEKKGEVFCPFCVGEFEECERRSGKPL